MHGKRSVAAWLYRHAPVLLRPRLLWRQQHRVPALPRGIMVLDRRPQRLPCQHLVSDHVELPGQLHLRGRLHRSRRRAVYCLLTRLLQDGTRPGNVHCLRLGNQLHCHRRHQRVHLRAATGETSTRTLGSLHAWRAMLAPAQARSAQSTAPPARPAGGLALAQPHACHALGARFRPLPQPQTRAHASRAPQGPGRLQAPCRAIHAAPARTGAGPCASPQRSRGRQCS
jgi:hypothetical protein